MAGLLPVLLPGVLCGMARALLYAVAARLPPWRRGAGRRPFPAGCRAMNAPIAASEPARYLSLSSSRRGEVSCSMSRMSSRWACDGSLVPRRNVRRGGVVEGIDAAQEPAVQQGELVAFLVGRGGEVRDVPVREDVHFQRPARGERDKRRPVLALEQHPLGFLLEAEDVLEQRAAVTLDRADQLGRARRDVRVGVDLSVRVVQRHADRFAAVLERKDLLDAGQRGQRGRPVRPGFHDRAHPGQGQACRGSRVLRGEAHHFAPAHGLPAAAQPHAGEVVQAFRRIRLPPGRGRRTGTCFRRRRRRRGSESPRGCPATPAPAGPGATGGRNTRFCRAAAIEIHSPVRGSWRMVAVGGRTAGARRSSPRCGGRAVSASSK